MNKYKLINILTLPIVWLVSCVHQQRKQDETIYKVNNTTGEAIAVDYLIQKYEREHKKFYEEEIGDGDYLEWPALDNRNLSEYCRNFLWYSIPGRNSDTATGIKTKKVLHYEKQNMNTSNIVLVHCKILKRRSQSYYLIRAPEPNCVYALRCTKKVSKHIFTIIHKYCDLEKKSIKRKRIEIIVGKIHQSTGQPIAKDKYLLEYELEHQESFKRDGDSDEGIDWPNAMLRDNLDSYCQQYIGECAPGRQRKGTKALWKTDKLQYQKLNTNEYVKVTIVSCIPQNASSVIYHMTKAPEENCVYALLRMGRNARSPLFIIFKHCDFENPNDQKSISQDP